MCITQIADQTDSILAALTDGPYALTLGPHAFYWLELRH